jgi:pilus assembly protein Flp/PilA
VVLGSILRRGAIKEMKPLLTRVLQEDDGQDLIEYGLLIGIITLASVLAITAVGGKVTGYFTTLSTTMP